MIRFEHVTKRYRGTSKPALHDVDFEVQRTEFVFLVGPSGSGKSTCLRMILREETPSEGRVVVLGRDLRALSSRKVPYFRRHIGAVFQDFRLLPTKSVFQNVAFALQVIGSSRAFIRQAVPEALALVGLQDMGKRLPHELSGGEQQRVAIARAIVNRPQILLADEPTGNLDPATSVDIMQLLARINATGTTVVMATHEAGFVDEMKRRVIELHEGDVVRDERHGGYGDTSSLPSLAPAPERGAASVAALTAVLEVHRETVASGPVPVSEKDAAAAAAVQPKKPQPEKAHPKATQPKATQPKATQPKKERPNSDAGTAPAHKPAPTPAPEQKPEPAPAQKPEPAPPAASTSEGETDDRAGDAVAASPALPPIPDVDLDLDELGLADRLGLRDDGGDDEVGPTR